jgi:transglutaminase-like putative cysteine protease
MKPATLLRLPLLVLALWCFALHAQEREFTFDYTTTIGPIAKGSGPLHVFIPLAASSDAQTLLKETIDSNIAGTIETEARFGNRFWHGVLEAGSGESVTVTVSSRVQRHGRSESMPDYLPPLSAAQRAQQADFLQANTLVPVNHPVLAPILQEIDASVVADNSAAMSRAIYDWVVDNVEYKKVGTGWGNGDTFWACNERYGNCTDFHALYISLARSRNIPARFEIGFPVPMDRPEGTIGGYHCWVQVYLPEAGWFPIDASEAAKDPAKRDYYYGAHPSDRILFSTGRDLQLGPQQQSGPLNYFIYPHVELDGKVYPGTVSTTFAYRQ